MIITKFLFLVSIFILLAGCETMFVQGQDHHVGIQDSCDGPERKSVGYCTYAFKIIKELDGDKPAVGVIPKAVVVDNCEQQVLLTKKSVDCTNPPYPYGPHDIRVKGGELKKDKFYILHSTPSNRGTVETNYLVIDHEFDEPKLKEYLVNEREKGRQQPMKPMK